MDNFEATVGFPNKKYEITYVPGKIYGLAYFNKLTPGWICMAGVLPYIYGCYQSFITLNDMISEDLDCFGTIFFELNQDLKPIKIITSINTTKAFEAETTGMNYDTGTKTLIQISYLDGDNIPKLEFEI
jgi:hypothetical protein